MCAAIFLSQSVALAASPSYASASVEDLSKLSIEELANIDLQVTSVSRRSEPISKAPAAIYVITQDDIRRSGVTSVVEALRLAPNLEVARRDATTWAVSARGFNRAEVSNKLQILVDGRTVYNPIHAGVFWDVVNVMVEDIDRIEVISGPGGTLWGANAMNGVVNIVTKSARDTQGGLARAQYGTTDRSGALRYGGPLGANGAWRAYGMTFSEGNSLKPNGQSAGDDWSGSQGGFRTDWSTDGNAFTVQGDAFNNPYHAGGQGRGGNIVARWTHSLAADAALSVQTYYDKSERMVPGVVDALETFDIEAQNNFTRGDHKVVWGGGYRVQNDRFSNTLNGFVLGKDRSSLDVANVFAQDTVGLTDRLDFTYGVKVENNTYTDWEYMPEARLGWTVSDNHFLWAAVSRAVRTPSRIERELQFPGILIPAPSFQSEKLIAYEVGWRGRLAERASATVAAYVHDYDDIRSTNYTTGTSLPVQFQNGIAGQTYGIESWADYVVLPWWRLSPGLNIIHKHLHLKEGVTEDSSARQGIGNDPTYQASLRSSMDLTRDVEFEVALRAVDDLSNPAVASYTSLDTRLSWNVTPALELSVGGFNLLDHHHAETGPVPQNEIRRTVYAGARWRF